MPAHFFPTAIGICGFGWNEAALTDFRLPSSSPADAIESETPPAFLQPLIARVQRHLRGSPEDFADLPYALLAVTDFQRRVYRETLAVKAGSTRSYGDLAAALALPPGGSRAVAAALGANPWPLLIPCHRVIGSDGKLTGFSGPGGVSMKARLLALEGAQLL